jgi:hypothetical protein
MVFETSVESPLNHLIQLLTREYFVEYSRRKIFKLLMMIMMLLLFSVHPYFLGTNYRLIPGCQGGSPISMQHLYYLEFLYLILQPIFNSL